MEMHVYSTDGGLINKTVVHGLSLACLRPWWEGPGYEAELCVYVSLGPKLSSRYM